MTSHDLPRSGEITIGRGDDATVRIDHATVSRKHVTLRLGEELEIIDHGSFNGTSIGGKKLAPNVPTRLDLATIAELGETMVVVQVAGAEMITGSRSAAASTPRPELSPAMQHLYRLAESVAQSNITVVVRGETGAGKEVLGEEIHKRSARAGGALVKLNCAAMPEQLLESELFGYERGAFTGATQTKPGLIEAADGGTLFLDEIGEMPLATQAKLLRVVETREVMRLGSVKPKAIDVRFVAATHRDLEDMVMRGTFRQDLYYRLNGVSLWIPPLRERVEEIPRLAIEFVARFCRESKRPILPISDAAMAVLKSYPWPGNVRELRNVMERAIVFCRSVAIAPDHLGLANERSSRPPSAALPVAFAATQFAPVPSSAPPTPPTPPPGAAGTVAFGSRLPEEMEKLERERILAALAQCGGNQTQAAEMLGISRRTLLRRLDEYNVPRPRKS
ncbi:MAG TPA: sigma 54-interacting transcriptional regulator [Labilithrix sp.]